MGNGHSDAVGGRRGAAAAAAGAAVAAPPGEEGMALRRLPSRITTLTKDQQLDIRAHQRTYQGAYIRTCIGVLSFSVLVMKLFSRDFAAIGLVFQLYALVLCIVGYLRGSNLDLYFVSPQDGLEEDGRCYFQTSGNFVLFLSAITGGCFVVLLALLGTT